MRWYSDGDMLGTRVAGRDLHVSWDEVVICYEGKYSQVLVLLVVEVGGDGKDEVGTISTSRKSTL